MAMLSVRNFSAYNLKPAGGVLLQQNPNVFIYPWIPNTPAGPGTTRIQPHERQGWFGRPAPSQANQYFPNTPANPKVRSSTAQVSCPGGCSQCPNMCGAKGAATRFRGVNRFL